MVNNPFNSFPVEVSVDGVNYPVNTDFRFGISLELEILSGEKIDIASLLERFYLGNIPPNIEAAIDKMIWFYKSFDTEKPNNDHTDTKKGGRCYDFAMDADVLLSSFLISYQIDLTKEKIHWWAFRRMMMNLPPESPFMRRIDIRTADISKKSKEERKYYKKMRAKYAIEEKNKPASMNVEERDAALMDKMRRRFEEAQKYAESKA